MRISTVGLIVALTFGLLTTPLSGQTQEAGAIRRIGFLSFLPPPESNPGTVARVEAFREGLRNVGWIEGQNIAVEYRWAAGSMDRLRAMAEELARLQVDLIVTAGNTTTRTGKQATTTIPIVMVIAADVVETGIVTSLARPGGNITGYSDPAIDLDTKLLELFKQTLPQATRVAVLWNPTEPYSVRRFRAVQAATQGLGLTIQSLAFRHAEDVESVLEAAAQERSDGLLAWAADYGTFGPQIAAFAAANRMPVISNAGDRVESHFGLMAYSMNIIDQYRRVASYVDKILKGAKPGDLPIERPQTFDLVVNLKTAKTLGITIPPIILYQATKVVQ